MQISLSVIIPTLNRRSYLETCLPSIRDQSHPPRECILVDQSDTDETRKFFESFDFGPVKKIYVHQKTKSLILARNNGLDHASDTEYLCFLDDDLVLFPDYFQKLSDHLKADTAKEYAGGMGTFEGRERSRSRLAELFFLPHDGDGYFLPNGMPTFPHWKKEYSQVEFLSGGLSMYRTSIIKAYRYDDRLIGYGYGDDVDVSYRISRKHKMFFEPAARCHHDDHSPGRDPGLIHRKQHLQNMFYLLRKNVGLSASSLFSFGWAIGGQMIQDLLKHRKGAFLGCWIALANILRGKLDSVREPEKKLPESRPPLNSKEPSKELRL